VWLGIRPWNMTGRERPMVTCSELGLAPGSPLSPPDWRWRRAAFIVEHGRRLSARDDAVVRKAVAYRRALARCRGEAGRRRLANRHPGLHAAVGLTQDGGARRVVEAALLAGADDVTIAARCAVPAAVVGLFHDLFFDVRSRLGSPSYLARHGLAVPSAARSVADELRAHALMLRVRLAWSGWRLHLRGEWRRPRNAICE
jgi:hypothetical protein